MQTLSPRQMSMELQADPTAATFGTFFVVLLSGNPKILDGGVGKASVVLGTLRVAVGVVVVVVVAVVVVVVVATRMKHCSETDL